MADSSPTKNIFRLFVIGILVGFLAGVGAAVYTVVVHKYLTYKLYFLIGYTFQNAINIAVGSAAVTCLIVVGIVAATRIISCFSSLFFQHPVREKLLGVVLGCLAVCIWAIDRAHQDWGYSAEHHKMIFWRYDIAIVLCVLALGWILMRIPLGKIAARIGRTFTVLVVLALITMVAINGALYLYTVYGISGRPNIILISIDDLRADHVGCYGYDRNTTPNIDAFARENVLFKNVFVHEPWTLPSHMSMLTGLYTITHGVYNWQGLNPRILTLTEYLKNAGYVTFGCVNSLWLIPELGFSKGFDRYLLPKAGYSPDDPRREAENQNKRIVTELKKIKQKPFFAFIHYYDVHSDFDFLPYDSPPPYNRFFTADNATDFHFRVPNIYASDYLKYINRHTIELTVSERRDIMDMYDNGIAYMDHCIDEFFQSLKSMGIYDETMIIVTADHGEEFQEHGYMLHENPSYYDELMHVPMIVKFPRGGFPVTSAVITQLVEFIDIMPSILCYLGITPLSVQGKSFLKLITGQEAGKDYVYALGSENWLDIRSKKVKLMSDDGLNPNRYRLFDLENDPDEQKDIAGEYPEIVEFLEKKLRTRIEESLELRARLLGLKGAVKDADGGKQFKPDEEQKKRLRSLGYIL